MRNECERLAERNGCSMAQLALAWCLRQRNVSSVIVGATRVPQLEENAKASGLRISAEVLQRIDELLPPPGS